MASCSCRLFHVFRILLILSWFSLFPFILRYRPIFKYSHWHFIDIDMYSIAFFNNVQQFIVDLTENEVCRLFSRLNRIPKYTSYITRAHMHIYSILQWILENKKKTYLLSTRHQIIPTFDKMRKLVDRHFQLSIVLCWKIQNWYSHKIYITMIWQRILYNISRIMYGYTHTYERHNTAYFTER